MRAVETAGLSVWLPGRGTVLKDLELALPQGSVTLLVGRNGTGHSTVLSALAGRLPAGAIRHGGIRIDEQETTGLTAAELAGAVRHQGGRPLPDLPLRQLLEGTDPQLLDDLGLGDVLDRVPGELEPTARGAARIALAVRGRGHRLLLLDQVLAPLSPTHRPVAARAIAAAARRGATVVWAEHLIEHALPVANLVLESLPGGEFRLSARQDWAPRTIPAPPLMALARALGLPREHWLDATRLADHPAVLGALPGVGGSRRWRGDTVAVIEGEQLGLPGHPVELRYGEPLGIVTSHPGDGRELGVARRILRGLGRPARAPLAGTATEAVGASVMETSRAWERRYRLPAGAVTERLAGKAELRPEAPLGQHSEGERAALRWALEAAKAGPRLFVEPTAGLDPAGRREWAAELADDATSVSVVVSSDIEFLVRACRRILVVDGEQVAGDGAPAAVLNQLPALPQLAELCAPRPITRVRECLAGLGLRRTA
ncbi:MAG: ATP-binding cassette domain-containing protein [Propionibacteriaceae bacterium]|nr:ATP-binding cassette domain-containing protein [Propionibacteriaceae bacterium]